MWPLAAFLILVSLHRFAGGAPSGQPTSKPIEVRVQDSINHRRIAGARVFVLSGDGAELAAAATDLDGIARLPKLSKDLKPKYVLVEEEGYFISGARWLDGLLEYHIPLTLFYVN
jgi:hypothetical protein